MRIPKREIAGNKEILQRAFDDERYRSEYNMAVAHAVVRLHRGSSGPHESQGEFTASVGERINYLRGLLERLDVIPISPEGTGASASSTSRMTSINREVFIVHGRDEAVKHTVAWFVSTLELTPIILHEQASQGRTIIEKFEAHSDVAFAIVLVMPDDEGRLRGSGELRPRGRQNVIWEWGCPMCARCILPAPSYYLTLTA